MALFSWNLYFPTGLESAILAGFLLLGSAGIWNLIVYREFRTLLAAVVHLSGGVLALFAGDLITLLVAWEVLTFSAFFLLPDGSSRPGQSMRLRYISVQIVAAVLFFVALVVQVRLTGSLEVAELHSLAQPFMLVALLIKAAVFPFHFWLIEAYPSASLGVTPFLSIFATKVGVVTAARLLRLSPGGFPLVGWLGAFSAVVAVGLALKQHNVRRLLSFHIVSQIGYMVAAIGLARGASVGPAVTAGLFHLLTHTFYKALLIMVAAYATVLAGGKEDLTTMGGLGIRRPILLLCGVIGAAAISGVPFTSGYASKYLLKGIAAGEPGIALLLEVASVGTGLSFIKFIYLIFFAPPAPATGTERNKGAHRSAGVPAGGLLPLAGIAAATVVMGIVPGRIPGVPATDFFRSEALLTGLRPLAGSVVLWLFLKRRLTDPEDGGGYTPMVQTNPGTPGVRLGRFVRRLHDQDPRVQLFVVLVALVGVVWFLLGG